MYSQHGKLLGTKSRLKRCVFVSLKQVVHFKYQCMVQLKYFDSMNISV